MINAVNSWMVLFLKIFGVEEGNVLTSLATTTLNNPADLSAIVVNHFKPPPKDNRA